MKKFDFRQDLLDEIKKSSSEYGVKLPLTDLDTALISFLTIQKKLVSSTQREVLCSPPLLKKIGYHPKKKVIERIAGHLLYGKNVNFYQSKRVLQSNFHDHLAYDWNIYHFHLADRLDKKSKFIEQANDLLFVYLTDNLAILLDTDKHRAGIFADTKWQEILHDFYPQILAPYLQKDMTNFKPDVTPIERQILWDKGYTLGLTKIRDKVYWSPGVARSTTGHSAIVMKTVNEVHRWLYHVESKFEEKFDQICKHLGKEEDKVNFKLQIGKVTIEIVDAKSGEVILTYPEYIREDL